MQAPPPRPAEVNVVIPALLNWIWPGAGYFLVGQKTKGITFCIVTLVLVIITVFTCGVGAVLYTPYMIALIIDAVMVTQRYNRGETLGEWQFF